MKTVPIGLLLLGLLAPFAAARAATECALEYRFTAHWDAKPRRFEVELLFDAEGRSQTQVRIAREWAGVADFERGVRDVRPGGGGIAVSEGSEPKKTWKVAHPEGGRVSVKYDLVNDVANVDDTTPIPHRDFYRNMLGAAYFHFFGEGALLVPESLADNVAVPACLTFAGLGRGWTFASSHGQGVEDGVARIRGTLSPADLQSAVYVGGDFRVHRRDIEGRPLYVAIRGGWKFDDGKFVDSAAAVVRSQRAFWNDFDFPYFLVTLLPNRLPSGSNGGTAIEHSFAMHAANDFTVPGATFYTLLAHEHQHTWIPRRIGSMGGEESEPRFYWFSEGFTDYLTHRVLLASGMWTLADYAKGLNDVIARYEGSPARNAANAVVLRDFWKDPDVERLPYMRGELVALRWSGALAAHRGSLDAILRGLERDAGWETRVPADRPEDYAVNRLQAALRKDLGDAVDRDVAAYVEQGETIPIGADFLGPCFTGSPATRPRFELGFDPGSFKAGTIKQLVAGSAAQKAGLREGMAVTGWSVFNGDTEKEAEIQVKEDGKVKTLKYLPRAARGIETWEFQPIPGAERRSDCKRWIAAR